MATYQHINDLGTTLAAAITSSGATTLTVASSTGYGTGTVKFVIRIEDELMLVTSISGTTWTVTRGVEGTTAATHVIGLPVNAVESAASINDLAGSGGGSTTVGAYGSLPSETDGARYLTTDSIYEFVGVSGAWKAFYSGQLVTVPPSGSWSWVNQGSSTVDTSIGAMELVWAGSASRIRAYTRTAPGTPYTVTTRFKIAPWTTLTTATDGLGYGLVFGDGTKLISFEITNFGASGGCGISLNKWTNFSTYAGSGYRAVNVTNVPASIAFFATLGEVHMRMQDDGTNLIWSLSIDGKHWEVFDTQSRTAYMGSGPTTIGVCGRTDFTDTWCQMVLIDWTVS